MSWSFEAQKPIYKIIMWAQNVQTISSVQLLSRVRLCDPMNCSTPGLPVHHQLPEFTQTHVHRVGDAIQPSHPLSSPSPPAPNPFQHQGLFQWVSSSHQVAKVLEFQPQHQSFQWTPSRRQEIIIFLGNILHHVLVLCVNIFWGKEAESIHSRHSMNVSWL